MNYAADRSGVSLESATTAVAKMAQLIGTRTRDSRTRSSSCGSTSRTSHPGPGQTFLDLAQAVEKVQDPYARAALKQDLFGRGAKELDGFIRELSNTMGKKVPVPQTKPLKDWRP